MVLRPRLRVAFVLALILTFGVSTPPARAAASIVVNSLNDTTGACSNTGAGTCTLRDAITYANATAGADSITFGGGGTITLTSSLPDIQDTVTIDGSGQSITVDGAETYKVLTVGQGKELNLKTVTIANGYCSSQDDIGSGITNHGRLNVTGSTFSGNAGCKAGGGIINYGTAAVTSSTFSNNQATFGGAIANESGTLTVTNSTFSNNDGSPPFGYLGDGYGGAIWNDHESTLTVNGGTFTSNSAETYGGAIASIGDATITSATFTSGSAATGAALSNGISGSNSGTMNVTSSAFTSNSATDGGAIYNGTNRSLTIKSSTFSKNAASTGAGISNDGGALSLTTTTFSDNSTTLSGYGGGIYSGSNGTVNVSRSAFDGNYAKYGGGLYNSSGTFRVSKSTLLNNRGWDGGGGMYNDSGTLNVTNSTLTGNTSTSWGNGGGIYNLHGTVTVTNSTIYGNSGIPLGIAGGIYNDGTSLTLHNTIVANNSAGATGDCQDNNNTLTADSHNFDSDGTCGSATTKTVAQLALGPLQNNGGATQTMALGVGSAALEAGDNSVCPPTDQRSVTRPQGPICDSGAFEYTGQLGPAFVVNETGDADDGECSTLVPGVAGCTLREALNASNARRGADSITFNIPAAATGCSAANHCTITLTAPLPAIATNLTLDGAPNSAVITLDGANSYQMMTVNTGKTFNLNALTLVNGKCDNFGDGGAIKNSGTLNVTNSAFSGNPGAGSGSSIGNYGTLTVSNSIFSNNAACPGFSGAIINWLTASVSNTTFSASSGTLGGAIYNNRNLSVTASTFSGNKALQGGAIFSNQGTVTVTNSTFAGNDSQQAGGAIYNSSGRLYITNSTISGNTAPSGGGIHVEVGTAFLQNTIVASNISADCSVGQGTVTADNRNLDGDGTCGAAATRTAAQIALGQLKNNGGPTQTMKPAAGSVALNAGDNAVCAAAIGAPSYGAGGVDQRGVKRPQGTICDIGSFEVRIK